jgi:hypothetical protein
MKCQKGEDTMKYTLVAVALLLLPVATFGQEFRGSISGIVSDPTGAVIPNVKIIATETRTGTKTPTVSDSAGQYTIPFLAPGDYQIEAQVPGFKIFLRKGIQLGSSDRLVVDLPLEVGGNSESVVVTADAPLINTENSSTGQTITTRQVEELPLNGRNPMMLAQLAIGVIATGQPSLVHPFDNAAAAAWSIGGTPAQTSEILIDGAPNATWDNRLAYSPPQDAVQEVRVKAFDADAAYGHTASGTINKIMKTGTNQLKGSLYEFFQPSKLGANSFFNNKSGLGNPATKFNQYGLTVGGPVFVPKVFNGHNKLFWFFSWEKLKDGQPNTDFTTVPTDAERGGDFSALLNIPGGSSCVATTGFNCFQLFNPFTGALKGSTVTRLPFVNNIIPGNLINPVSRAYLSFFPEPNVPGQADGFMNYGNTSTTNDAYSNELARFDYNMSKRSRLAFNVRHNDELQTKNNFFGNLATGSDLSRVNWGATVDEVYTLAPTTVLDLRFNYTRMNEIHTSPSNGFDATTLGFPSYITSSSLLPQLPFIGFNGSCGSQVSYQCLGDTGSARDPSTSYQLFGDVVKIVGSHTLKFGSDFRRYRLDNITYGNAAGTFTFSTNWTRGPNASSAASTFGQDFASFLLGLPTSGQFDVNALASFHSYYYAAFLQDDWRVKRNLTLNVGIRFDHDSPYSEDMGATVNGFAARVANPVAGAAIAAYANHPISQIPAGSFMVPGGLTFASPGNGAAYQNSSHMISPRLGFAWSPSRFHDKTVIRGGFGIFVQPITIANLGESGTYSTTPLVDQEGFSQTTQFIVPSNFLLPTNTLGNPFPSGILTPVGSANGLSTFNGQTVSFLNPQMKDPYSERWTLGIQHSLKSNLLLEVAYIGNHAVHLPIAVTQLNTIPRQFLSTLSTRDQTLITALTASTPNPFAGLLPGTSLNSANTTVAQLLAKYPEFPVGSASGSTGVIEQNLTIGSSYFNSLNVRVEKRLSGGLMLIGLYGFSKLIERDSWLNDTDPLPEKRISPFDHTHRFVTAASYALPFGRGNAAGGNSRWQKLLFGGWSINSIYTYQTGAPIVWANGSTTTPGDYIYLGGTVNLNNRQVDGPAFTTSQFVTASSQQYQFHIRTFATTFGNLRQDAINNLDSSLLKRFVIRESRYLELRFEAFNVFNRPEFGAPNTTETSSSFGQITTQLNRPRQVQLGARFVF